jgi:ligand-binding sensor domain-containing protein
LFAKKIYAFLFFIVLCSYFITAQNPPSLTLIHISESNGLSDNNIQAILKDKEGKVWVGTADGLNVLDGSIMKKFFSVPGRANSIPSNKILSLAEDTMGDTWMGTGQGICCYQKNKQAFFSALPPPSEYGVSAIVNSTCFLNATQLWCGTEGGLYLFDINTKKFTPYLNTTGDTKNNYRLCNNINDLLLDSDKNLWICTKDGLWKMDAGKKEFRKINGQPGDNFYHPLCFSVFESSDKKIWTGSWKYGLQQINKTTGSVIPYHKLPGAIGNVNCISELPTTDGKYLLLLNGELKAFDPFENKFVQLPKPLSLQQYPDIKTIYRSEDGWLWLGTGNDGLFIASPHAQHFEHHFFDGSFTSQSVLLSEWNNDLLIGAEGTSLLKMYDSNWVVVKDFYHNIFPSPAGIPVFATLSLVKENDNSWWIGTSAGLIHIDPKTNSRHWFIAGKKDSSSLPADFVTHIHLDKEKQLWVFPWRQGVWKMDVKKEKFIKRCNGFVKQAGIEKKLVIADAAEDAAGNIWMGDIDEGIVLFEKSSGQFSKPFTKQLGEMYNTSKIYYRNGFMYSYTDNLMLKWKDKSSIQKIPLPEGMNKELYDMAPDKNNNWWLAGKSGLIYFNEKQNSFKKFTTGDGLVSNNMNGTLYCRNNGDMLFATSTYCTQFSPEKLLYNSNNAQKVLLTAVYVNDSLIIPDSNAIELTYRQNNLLFQWALPSFTNPFANNYYCRLQGIDTSWRYVGNKGEIQYANLSSGKYNILLKAASANGIESSNIISYQFIILLPYWKRWWFLTTVSALAALLLFWSVRKRITAIRRKAALQKEISELEMKALRAQMNPHFIFNSLNSIQECIVTKNTDAAYNYLSQFSKLVRRILENSGKVTVPITEELELMKWYMSLEKLRFTDEFEFTIQNKFSNTDFEIPSMVIQPFIENALWHGLANKQGEKKLQLLVFESKDMVNIVIEDNGIGRKAAAGLPNREGKTSMGLQIAKERLQHYSYASSVEIIDLMDTQGNACGTKVIIHLPNY